VSGGTLLDRRQLLAGGSALISGFFLGPLDWLGDRQQRPGLEATVGQQLGSFLRHRESARHVGRAYLEVQPREADVPRLVVAILGDLATRLPHREIPGGTLARLLDERIRHDFAEGWLVSVGGWMLSRTEARLCALAELA
jgi:hypothetical protein